MLDNNNKSIAFVLDNLSASQIAHSAIYQINKYLSDYSDNIFMFFIDTAMPCLSPGFAIHHTRDIGHYYGNLISTSFKTSMEIKDCTRCKRFYYINELEWKRPWFSEQNNKDFVKLMLNKEIGKFCRSNEHSQALTNEFAVNALVPNVVEHFQINKILEIVNA